MKNNKLRTYVLLLVLAVPAVWISAKVRLPHFVTDSMVVQQQSRWTVNGSADGKKVSVTTSWNGKTSTATVCTDGKFSVDIVTPKAGGPYTITFDDGSKTTLRDVYSGEVWLCSGQSNMECP